MTTATLSTEEVPMDGQQATEIVGYTYAGETYCPRCVVGALPTGAGGRFDGWGLAAGVRMATEENLSDLAYAFGFDRSDELSFDSADFPKVILASAVWDTDAACGACGEELTS